MTKVRLYTKPYSTKDAGVEGCEDGISELIGVTFEDGNRPSADEASSSKNGGASERRVENVGWIAHAKMKQHTWIVKSIPQIEIYSQHNSYRRWYSQSTCSTNIPVSTYNINSPTSDCSMKGSRRLLSTTRATGYPSSIPDERPYPESAPAAPQQPNPSARVPPHEPPKC